LETSLGKRKAAGNPRISDSRAALGRRAEALTAKLLEKQGYRILGRNVRIGHLELDIIAQRGNMVIFCEVRARSNDRWISPAQSINHQKIARLRRAAGRWLSGSGLAVAEVRFDAASVVYDIPEGRMNYFEGAF
jgi:putative endonuclease